jgi:hypothetical protein
MNQNTWLNLISAICCRRYDFFNVTHIPASEENVNKIMRPCSPTENYCLHFQGRRQSYITWDWRKQIPHEQWNPSSKQHGATFQEPVTLMLSAMRTCISQFYKSLMVSQFHPYGTTLLKIACSDSLSYSSNVSNATQLRQPSIISYTGHLTVLTL